MSATCISMAATATCSTSLHLSNKISSNLSFECPLLPIPKPKPHFSLKIKTHFPNSLHFLSRSFVSRAFENIGVTEETQSQTDSEEIEDPEEDGDDDDKSEKQSSEAGRLYIGNLPYAMTSSQLSEIFSQAGHVLSVEIVYDRVTDRSRGFGFVTMASVEGAKEAIRLFDGSQIGGRTVKVNFPEVPKGGEREVMGPRIRSSYQGFIDSPHKIYAGNLSWGLSSQGLREAFADQPGLLSAKVIYDRDTGRSRGFGFITFSSPEEVQSALSTMNEVEVEGRPLRLNLAAEKAPPPSPPSEGNLDSSEMFTSISS